MDDFCSKVERMERLWMCFISFFFLRYLHAHSHIINTHTHPRSRSWTLKHEMNMSSVNFDWHFHSAPGFIEHYTYQNELPTIKNSLLALRGSPVRRVNSTHLPITTQPITIHLLLRKHKENRTEMHARCQPDTYVENTTWKHTGALTRQLHSTSTLCYFFTASLGMDRLALGKYQIAPSKQKCNCWEFCNCRTVTDKITELRSNSYFFLITMDEMTTNE